MKRLLAVIILALTLLAGCDPVTGVPDYNSNTGRYTCPAGSYEDLSTDGRQICRSR